MSMEIVYVLTYVRTCVHVRDIVLFFIFIFIFILAIVFTEGSATAEKSVRDFEFTERFQDFSKDFRFQLIQQKISRFQQRISAEISRFHVISGEISRFQQRFHGSQRTAYSQGMLRGAGASATECDTASARVCMREVKGIC